jgi:methionyl-tRNA synthetase
VSEGTVGQGSASESAAAATAEVTIEEFQRIELKVGTIRRAEPHPNADRLVVLGVDLGEPEERQLVAGIRAAYPPEELVGRQIVVVANLKPAKLRGVESRGMILAASDESGLALVQPAKAIRPGSRVK